MKNHKATVSNEYHDNAKAHGFYEDDDNLFVLLGLFKSKKLLSKQLKVDHCIDIDKLFDHAILLTRLARIALIMSECGELVDAVRKPGSSNHKELNLLNEEEDLADINIRLQDYCARYNVDLAHATYKKHLFNLKRKYKHDKNI